MIDIGEALMILTNLEILFLEWWFEIWGLIGKLIGGMVLGIIVLWFVLWCIGIWLKAMGADL